MIRESRRTQWLFPLQIVVLLINTLLLTFAGQSLVARPEVLNKKALAIVNRVRDKLTG